MIVFQAVEAELEAVQAKVSALRESLGGAYIYICVYVCIYIYIYIYIHTYTQMYM